MSSVNISLDDGTVLIIGGGPIGMLSATVLAYYGVRSVVLERNNSTTKWPKMDLTNARSMELFRKVGINDMVRESGVPSEFPYTVKFSTSMNASEPISQWDLFGTDEYRTFVETCSDGTQAQEPYQRISQAVFEAGLRRRCDENPLIDLRFGWKAESVEETDEDVKAHVTELGTGRKYVFSSRYVVGCDGASSRVRRSLEMPLDGGPGHGQFWHYFVVSETQGIHGAVIAQDEVDTWTTHLFLPIEVESDHISSEDIVAKVMGGANGEPYHVAIDEVLVRSNYRSHMAVARTYSSPKKRIFLAGDAAHQNSPAGGYGMNMGIGDAFDLGWQLAAVVNGHAGKNLLLAYEQERRPVALMSVEQSGKHMAVHLKNAELLQGNFAPGSKVELTEQARATMHAYFQQHDAENKSLGVEMGYRYQSPIIIPDRRDSEPPTFDPRRYVPSTWPGMRAPHLKLRDGTSIYDQLGPMFSLVQFAEDDVDDVDSPRYLMEAAKTHNVPLKHVRLVGEDAAFKIWGERLVLVRPDHHVAWRATACGSDEADRIIRVVSGREVAAVAADSTGKPREKFTATFRLNTQSSDFEFERMGAMQM